jgi:hypothetical protein
MPEYYRQIGHGHLFPEYCNVPAVGNMAVVYNGCHSNQSTVERDIKQYGGRDVNKMADAREAAGATNIT